MSRIRKFDPERLAELRRWHSRGLNAAALSELFGEPYGTVYKVLRRGYRDSPPESHRRNKPGRPPRFTGKTLALLRHRRAEGRSLTQLATEFGAGKNTVINALRRAEKPYSET